MWCESWRLRVMNAVVKVWPTYICKARINGLNAHH